MNNPWEEIELDDYENHMSLDSVYQLQALNEMMKEQIYTYSCESLMILGIAGGNGLEHIDTNIFQKVYGIDINRTYLNECKSRYPALNKIFIPICADLTDSELKLPAAQLLVANLLIEYIGYDCFKKAVKAVKPQHISCIIQIDIDESYISDSPYIHTFDRLDEIHHQIEEKALIIAMYEIGYSHNMQDERILPNGKKLVRLDFVRNSPIR